jgi:hypothetical protein
LNQNLNRTREGWEDDDLILSEAMASLRGAAMAHASSAVKLRKGAIQRSMAWVICQSAVCAERLARLLGAVV